MSAQREVWINEVSSRDGLQNEPRWVETADKIGLVDAFTAAGVPKVEVTSFVSPKAVPALADAAEVFAGIMRAPDTVYVALVPNLRGAEAALKAGTNELNFVLSASDSHNRANMGISSADSLAAFTKVSTAVAQTSIVTHATIATSFGCPFEGTEPSRGVPDLAERLVASGVQGLTLADTTGMANPRQVARMAEKILARFPDLPITFHFHDTRGMGLANIMAAFQAGIRRFDASLGGLGGCPFAPGATGNVCTEDVVHMFEEMGVPTGIDLVAMLALSRTLPDLLGHEVPGRVAKAGVSGRRYPLPASPGA